MKEATHGLANLDLQDQELKDMEVARRLQEEEIKVQSTVNPCFSVLVISGHL